MTHFKTDKDRGIQPSHFAEALSRAAEMCKKDSEEEDMEEEDEEDDEEECCD